MFSISFQVNKTLLELIQASEIQIKPHEWTNLPQKRSGKSSAINKMTIPPPLLGAIVQWARSLTLDIVISSPMSYNNWTPEINITTGCLTYGRSTIRSF